MSAPRYKALLIGNGVFDADPHTLARLRGPANDLKVMQAALTDAESGLFAAEDVSTLLDGTRDQVLRTVGSFLRGASMGDHLLLYYSGHGLRDNRERLYLCARDTLSDRLVESAVSDAAINLIAEESIALKLVIVLDCCHSGGFKGGDVFGQLKHDSGRHDGSGRCIIASSANGELSRDAIKADGASTFTRFFAEALTSRDVDDDGDGCVQIGEVFKYVKQRVYEANQQTVQWWFDKTFGEAPLAKARAGGRKRKPAPELEPATPPERERPVLELSETKIDFPDVQAGEKLPVERVEVLNVGGGELDWTFECEEPWIKAERKGDHLLVSLDTVQPGRRRGKVIVRDRGRGGVKTVLVSLHVAEKKAPPPPPPEPPPPPPPPPNHDAAFVQALQGWWMNNAGAIRIRLEGGVLVLHDFNLVGLSVGQGTIQVQNNVATVQGMNSIAGPYTGQLGIQGNMLNASLMIGGQMAHVMFMRQQPWFAGFAP